MSKNAKQKLEPSSRYLLLDTCTTAKVKYKQIMVIYKCYFSREHIALSKTKTF